MIRVLIAFLLLSCPCFAQDKMNPRRVLKDSIYLSGGDILENVILDATRMDGPALVILKTGMLNNVRVRNVKIIHKGDSIKDIGILLDADVNVCAFNRFEATIINASTGVKVTGKKFWNSANTFEIATYGCKRSIVVDGRSSQNTFRGHIHPGPKNMFFDRNPDVGVYCNSRSNIFDLHFWDWQKFKGTSTYYFDKDSRRNVVRQRFQNHHITDLGPKKESPDRPVMNRWRETKKESPRSELGQDRSAIPLLPQQQRLVHLRAGREQGNSTRHRLVLAV